MVEAVIMWIACNLLNANLYSLPILFIVLTHDILDDIEFGYPISLFDVKMLDMVFVYQLPDGLFGYSTKHFTQGSQVDYIGVIAKQLFIVGKFG